MGVPTLALQIIFEHQTPKAMEQPPRNVWFSLGIQSNDNWQIQDENHLKSGKIFTQFLRTTQHCTWNK